MKSRVSDDALSELIGNLKQQAKETVLLPPLYKCGHTLRSGNLRNDSDQLSLFQGATRRQKYKQKAINSPPRCRNSSCPIATCERYLSFQHSGNNANDQQANEGKRKLLLSFPSSPRNPAQPIPQFDYIPMKPLVTVPSPRGLPEMNLSYVKRRSPIRTLVRGHAIKGWPRLPNVPFLPQHTQAEAQTPRSTARPTALPKDIQGPGPKGRAMVTRKVKLKNSARNNKIQTCKQGHFLHSSRVRLHRSTDPMASLVGDTIMQLLLSGKQSPQYRAEHRASLSHLGKGTGQCVELTVALDNKAEALSRTELIANSASASNDHSRWMQEEPGNRVYFMGKETRLQDNADTTQVLQAQVIECPAPKLAIKVAIPDPRIQSSKPNAPLCDTCHEDQLSDVSLSPWS